MRRFVSSGARALTAALSRAGFGGLHDLGPAVTVFVPDVRDGSLRLARLFPGERPMSAEARFSSPPRSVEPASQVEAFFGHAPWRLATPGVEQVRGARVVGPEGALIDPATGRLFLESASSRLSVAGKLDVPRRVRLLEPLRVVDGAVVVLPTFRSENYFHFVTDVLTRLLAFADGGAEGVRFLLDAGEPRWQREFLELLGLRVDPVELAATSNLLVEELVFPRFVGVKPEGSGLTFFPPEVLAQLGAMFREAAGVEAEPAGRRVYLSRSGAAWRRLANEEAVLPVLEAYGFEVVCAERLSVRDQIRLLADAEVVAGPHGAAFANLVFTQRPVVVVELHDPRFLWGASYTLADTLGHAYWYALGEPDAESLDFTVRPELLARTLAEAL